jgi:hypothetical protein
LQENITYLLGMNAELWIITPNKLSLSGEVYHKTPLVKNNINDKIAIPNMFMARVGGNYHFGK